MIHLKEFAYIEPHTLSNEYVPIKLSPSRKRNCVTFVPLDILEFPEQQCLGRNGYFINFPDVDN